MGEGVSSMRSRCSDRALADKRKFIILKFFLRI